MDKELGGGERPDSADFPRRQPGAERQAKAPGPNQVQQLARLAEAGERARQESGRAIGRTAQSAYGQGPKHDKEDPRPRSAERTPAGAPATKEARGRLRLPGLKGASLRSRVLAMLASLRCGCAWLRARP